MHLYWSEIQTLKDEDFKRCIEVKKNIFVKKLYLHFQLKNHKLKRDKTNPSNCKFYLSNYMHTYQKLKLSQHASKTIYKLFTQKVLKTNAKREVIGFRKVYTQQKLANIFNTTN